MKVLFLVADSVRPDFLGCYNQRCATPTIDGLAASGVRFETTRSSAPWTVPSIAAMMTGVWSHRLGLVKWEQPWDVASPTIFQMFRDARFRVASFVFDPCHLFFRCPEAGVVGSSQDTEQMLSWFSANSSQDYFVFLHYWWTHIPYLEKRLALNDWNRLCREMISLLATPDAELRADNRRKLVGLYSQAIDIFSERWLPRILDAADADVVVVTADHGESWGERMGAGEYPRDVFDLHGNHLHDDVIKVPWILHAPDLVGAAQVRGQARTVDMLPTLLDILELPGPKGDISGVSLSDAIRKGEISDPSISFFARNRDFVDRKYLPAAPAEVFAEYGCCDHSVKLLMNGTGELTHAFDMRTDPGERNALAADRVDAGPLGAALRKEARLATVGSYDAEDHHEMRLRLQSLGYLDAGTRATRSG